MTKEKTGKDYAQSTNTDIFLYSIQDKETKNLTEGRLGYDVQPQLSPDGKRMAWLSMANDGYEADKNDLIVMDLETGYARNLTAAWDETVDGSFRWANSGKSLDFTASYRGTKVLFTVPVPANLMDRSIPVIEPLLQGEFDINSIVLETKDGYVLSRNDFHHAPELFYFQEKRKTLEPLTHINSSLYEKVKMGHSELKMVQTNDGKEMGVWVVYPPDFDPTKKYPTLLYCQGGPQSALTQFYSYRWNLQLMAANGYIVVAPNRRGMPGWEEMERLH